MPINHLNDKGTVAYMEERKVVKHGPATLMVSLPAPWARRYNVRRGEVIQMEEKGHRLVIHSSPPKQKTQNRTILDLNTLDRKIIRELIGIAYKCGYNIIQVKYQDPDILPFLQKQVVELFKGCEVMETTPTSCVIRHLHIDAPEEFDPMVRRMFIVLQEFGDRVISMLTQKKPDRSILAYENMMNRLCNYCHRLLLKPDFEKEKSAYFYVILWVLEKISDEYAKIVNYTSNQESFTVNRQHLALLKKITSVYGQYYKLFYRYSVQEMLQIKTDIMKLKEQSLSIDLKQRDEFWISLHNIITKLQESVNSIIGYHC